MKYKHFIIITILIFVFASCRKSVLEGTESSVSENGDIKKIQIVSPLADIRTGCSNTSNIVQKANQNSTYDVINKVSDWYAVQLPDNTIGFIPENQCKPIVDETTPIDMPSVAQRTPAQVQTGNNAPTNNPPTKNDTGKNSNIPANDTKLSSAEQEMVNLVNQARAQNSLPALKVDPALTNVARIKAKDMIDNNYFSHNSPTYGSPFDMMKSFSIRYLKAGENIAGNQSVQGAHNSLMNSPGHRANILSPDYTHIGIGIVEGGNYGNMFSQMFISK